MEPNRRPGRRVAIAPGALRRAREDAGLSITTLATMAQVSYSHLSAVEAGKEGISAEALARVTRVLGIRIADLREEPDGAAQATAQH